MRISRGVVLLLCCWYAPGASGRCVAAGDRAESMSPLWIVVPGKAVGPIELGMSMEEVKERVGEPERTSLGGWEYLGDGYAILFDSHHRTVSAILGGSGGEDPHSPLVKKFVARTPEGIGMGSTRAQVVAAYGEPDSSRSLGQDWEGMTFRQGLELVLIKGLVQHLTVRAPMRPPAPCSPSASSAARTSPPSRP